MTALRVLMSRIGSLLAGARHERLLSEEIDTHLEMLADEFEGRGLSRAEARLAARREFGGLAVTRESTRDARGFPGLASVLQDVRFALRQLRQHPGFAAAAVLTLAVGIGATTGIFTVVDMALLRVLPFPDADRLVAIHERIPARGTMPVSPADAERWKQSVRALDRLGLLAPGLETLTGAGDPVRIAVDYVTPDVLPMMGARPLIGRLLVDGEDSPGQDRVVVMSHGFWQQRFNGDASVVGRALRLDGVPHEVVGVLTADSRPVAAGRFYTIDIAAAPPQLWKPLAFEEADRRPIGNYSFGALARLASGVSLATARTELAAAQEHLRRELPAKGDVHTEIVPLQQQVAARSRDGLQLLAVAVAAVLLIGCANVASLLLARALARQREIAVRQALGAGPRRILRQLLVESVTLCAIGGAVSLIVAYAVIRFLVANAPAEVPRLDEVAFNGRVVLLSAVASLGCAALIAILPSARLMAMSLVDAISSRGMRGHRATGRLRSLVVSTQIAVSMACLVAAALLLQSFVQLLNVDRGFDTTQLLTVELSLAGPGYEDEARRGAFAESLLDSAATMPGVTAVAVASRLPLTGTGANSALSVDGTTLPVPERPLADVRSVTPEYFSTLELPIIAGRSLTPADNGRLVTVLSSTLAEQGWPGQDPIGRRLRFGSNPSAALFEVVGIVQDARNQALDLPATPTAYVPFPQRTGSLAAVIVRTTGEPTALSTQLRKAVHDLDPLVALSAFRTMEDVADETLALRKFQLQLVLFFAAAAIVLTVVGVYGLMAYAVTQRTGEFGVRLALGARPEGLIRLVLWDAMRLTLLGISIGVPAVLIAGPALKSLLYGVSPADPRTLIAITALISAAALSAASVPGLRASRIEPSSALRAD